MTTKERTAEDKDLEKFIQDNQSGFSEPPKDKFESKLKRLISIAEGITLLVKLGSAKDVKNVEWKDIIAERKQILQSYLDSRESMSAQAKIEGITELRKRLEAKGFWSQAFVHKEANCKSDTNCMACVFEAYIKELKKKED